MSVLVTGGSGFSAMHIIRYLLKAELEVIAITRRAELLISNFGNFKNFRALAYSIENLKEEHLPEDIEYVVHTAAQSPEEKTRTSDYLNVNANGTANLVKSLAKLDIKKIINLSSTSVYGSPSVGILDADTTPKAPCIYGLTKFLAEEILNEEFGEKVLHLRLPAIVGKGAHRNWPSRIINKILSDECIDVFNREQPFNNVFHIDDLNKLILHILNFKDQLMSNIVPVGSDGYITIMDLVNIAERCLNKKSKVNFIDGKRKGYCISIRQLKDELSFKPLKTDQALKKFYLE